MFLPTTTKMSELMIINPCHFGCINSAVLTGLRQMYIDGSCPSLGIGIKISGLSVGTSVTVPNKGCCIVRFAFLLTHIIPRAEEKMIRPTKKSFHVFSFDDTVKKVAMRFEGEKDQDAICEITLCKYLNPENELPIGPSIRFLCVAHLV